jgi:sugar lactone lactonase YvrE
MKAATRLFPFAAFIVALGALASAAAAQGLYWIDTNYSLPTINRATVDGVAITSVPLAAGTLPEGLALDANGHVYWTESAWTNAKVNVASAAIAGPFPIVTGGSAFRGIAVDGVASLVYWTTSNQITGATIRRSALNGSGATTPVTLGSGANPRGIAVDHAGGKIYWADFDQNAIFRANLDGSAVTSLISLPAESGPYGVAVDSPSQRLYWTEYGTGTIKRANTDGTAAITLESGLINPTYIALDLATARMYWSEGGAGSQHVRRASTAGGPILTLPCPLRRTAAVSRSIPPFWYPRRSRRQRFHRVRARAPVAEPRQRSRPGSLRAPARGPTETQRVRPSGSRGLGCRRRHHARRQPRGRSGTRARDAGHRGGICRRLAADGRVEPAPRRHHSDRPRYEVSRARLPAEAAMIRVGSQGSLLLRTEGVP